MNTRRPLPSPKISTSENVVVPACLGLLNLVVNTVREVPWPDKVEFFSIRSGEKFRADSLMVLLTYAYATGKYGSRDVEGIAFQDVLLQTLCGPPLPDWKTIRRFRRVHRLVLRQCILTVLHTALQVRFGDDTEAVADHCVAVALDHWFEPLCVPFPDQEATERIERAVLVDEQSHD